MDRNDSLGLELNDENIDIDFSDTQSDDEINLQKTIEKCLDKTALYHIAEAVRISLPTITKIEHLVQRMVLLITQLRIEGNFVDGIVDGLKIDNELKWCLLIIVKSSAASLNGIPGIEKMASKAITILNAARVSFFSMDLSHIQIPGADLSGGIFCSSDFSSANLSKANVQDANFREVNFQGANLFKVQLGEQPYFKPGGGVRSFVFSPNNEFMASAMDKIIKIYTVRNREWVRTFKEQASRVNSIAWSPNKQLLASGSEDGAVQVWSVKNGTVFKTLNKHTGPINTIAWSPDGEWLASGGRGHSPFGESRDYNVRVWKVMSGTVKLFSGHTSHIETIAWSPNGKWLASGSREIELAYNQGQKDWGYKMYIWEAMNGKVFKDLSDLSGNTGYVDSIAWSPDGQWLASGHSDNTIRIWVVENGTVLKILKGHTNCVISVAWSSNGKMLASGSRDKTVRVWEVETGIPLKISMGHTDTVNSVVWFSDEETLASGSDDETVRIWEIKTSIPPKVSMGHTGTVNSISWSPDGKKLVSGSSDCTVHILETVSGAMLKIIKRMVGIDSVVWSPDGAELASSERYFSLGTEDNRIHICKVASSEVLKVISGHKVKINSIAWSPDRQWLASGSGDPHLISSSDNTVRLWEVTSGRMFKVFNCPKAVNSVAWFPHMGVGMELLAFSSGDTVSFLQIAKNILLSVVLKGHKASVISIAWFPKVEQSLKKLGLASGSDDNTIRLWEVISGKELSVLKGHTASVTSVAWSPGGQWLASGSADKTVRIWEVASKQCVREVNFFQPVNTISWNSCYPDLIAVGYGKEVCSFSFTFSQQGCKAQIQSLHTSILRLNFMNANIKGVTGLSDMQYKLLEQLGSKGKPFIEEEKKEKIKEDNVRGNILSLASESATTQLKETGAAARMIETDQIASTSKNIAAHSPFVSFHMPTSTPSTSQLVRTPAEKKSSVSTSSSVSTKLPSRALLRKW